MTQLGLDYSSAMKDAEDRRNAGIEKSVHHSGDEWREYAITFVRRHLTTHRELFVDDLWDEGLTEPDSARALGAVIQHAAREGWMRQKRVRRVRGDLVVEMDYVARPSVRSNMSLKPVWESLLL